MRKFFKGFIQTDPVFFCDLLNLFKHVCLALFTQRCNAAFIDTFIPVRYDCIGVNLVYISESLAYRAGTTVNR